MTDYPVDNSQSHPIISDPRDTVGTPGKSKPNDGNNTISAPGMATTPNPSLVISVSGPKATTTNNVSAGML